MHFQSQTQQEKSKRTQDVSHMKKKKANTCETVSEERTPGVQYLFNTSCVALFGRKHSTSGSRSSLGKKI